MTRPREYQTEAIVIKKTKLGEADRILTLYTPGLGKIQAVAKSVRKAKSKMAGHLELLTYSQITLARGRNLDIVIGAQTIDALLPLKADLWLTSCGLYATELVNQFTPEHTEDDEIFRLLLSTVQGLCRTDNPGLLLRYFEVRLLDAVGFRPQLRECVSCHEPLQPVVNSFSASGGGTVCPLCAMKQPFAFEITVNALKVLRFMQDHDLAGVLRLRIDPPLARELEALTRRYLKYLLERDVKSVAWLDELREQLRRPPPKPPAPLDVQ